MVVFGRFYDLNGYGSQSHRMSSQMFFHARLALFQIQIQTKSEAKFTKFRFSTSNQITFQCFHDVIAAIVQFQAVFTERIKKKS